MGTLKSTLKLESTDLFPTPVSFTVVNNNIINGTYAGFNAVTLGAAGVTTVLSSATGTTGAYLYVSSPSTNNPGFISIETNETAPSAFARLFPGDVMFLPYRGNTATSLTVLASGSTSAQKLEYFYGVR